MKTIRIGNGCGFWGDSQDAPIRLAESGRLDYLTLEYLAELTMSILALQKQKDPNAGFAGDFIDVLTHLIPVLQSQPGLKIVTNAGGMNPHACARKIRDILDRHGLADVKIGIVDGDDLMPGLDDLLAAGHHLNHLDTGESLATIRGKVVSANAYLGGVPIAECLRLGAGIVITGRVADASLVLGPCLHEFHWPHDDWNLLSAGTVAGHLIECGAQATGGLWMNANDETRLETVGYPIAEIAEDGRLTVSKPVGSGGVVNLETISEQLLYEVADPARYYTPDVIADFTTPVFHQSGPDIVSCQGARGWPASDSYKVSVAYRDGFTASGMLTFIGPQAARKARRSGEILLDRLKQSGFVYAHANIEVLGAGDLVPGVLPMADPPEAVMRVAVRDPNRAAVERFTREFAPLVTSGYAGTSGYTTGRPVVREVFAYWPALVAKSAVHPRSTIV